MYQGHHNDGSGIQKHSCGGLYPYIVFAKQAGDALLYGVLEPTGKKTLFKTYDAAVDAAIILKGE